MFIRAAIVDAAWFLWLYGVAAFPVYLAYRSVTPLLALLALLAPYVLFAWFRKVCKNLFFFALSHLSAAAGTFALLYISPARGWLFNIAGIGGVNVFLVFSALFLAAAFLRSFRTRLMPAQRFLDSPARYAPEHYNPVPEDSADDYAPDYHSGTAVFFTITLIGACLTCEYHSAPVMARIAALDAMTLLILLFVFEHLHNVDGSLSIIGNPKSQPVFSILKFNNQLIAAVAGLMFAAAVAAVALGLDRYVLSLLTKLGNGLLWLLRKIFSGKGAALTETEILPFAPEMPPQTPMSENPYAAEEPWLFWEILSRVLYVAGVLLLIGGAIGIAVYAVYRMNKLFNQKISSNEAGDTSESLFPDAVERMRKRFFTRERKPANRVRRAFYKKVRKYMADGKYPPAKRCLPTDTALEMAAKIKASEDIDALAVSYQKERYSES
ncbi:MAG: hypothetical protein LBR83_08715 [Clostridiales bacterium]|nr:hypothetical protein [Clostridiales bacterium]